VNQGTHMNLLSGRLAGEFVIAILADPKHPTTDRAGGISNQIPHNPFSAPAYRGLHQAGLP
jgi:hypothetical protein